LHFVLFWLYVFMGFVLFSKWTKLGMC
jgi:hypothetical protein